MKYPLGNTENEFIQYLRMMAEELNVHTVNYEGWEYTAPGWQLLDIKDKKATFVKEKLVPSLDKNGDNS